MLGDDGNTAAIEKLYELGIWKPSSLENFTTSDTKKLSELEICSQSSANFNLEETKLAKSRKFEWHDGYPKEHSLYSTNETLDKEFEDFIALFGKKYNLLQPQQECSYLENPKPLIPLIPPCAIEYTGDMRCPGRPFSYAFSDRTNKKSIGWKMHISARISSAKKIAEIVLPYLEEQEIHYKFLPSIAIIRQLYNASRYGEERSGLQAAFSQRGKFIVIYPESDEKADEVAVYLDKKFKEAGLTREDFVYVNGDFQVGDSGGIYTRFTCYDQDFDTERGHLNIGPKTLLTYLEGALRVPFFGNGNIQDGDKQQRFFDDRGLAYHLGRDYTKTLETVNVLAVKLKNPDILNRKHPFSLGLKHRGEKVPEKILDILQFIGNEPDIDTFRDYFVYPHQ
jgi:hypothetical protein